MEIQGALFGSIPTATRTLRRAFDFYPTPAWATRVLLERVPIHGRVLECCAGAGDIAATLTDGADVVEVIGNDPHTERGTWRYELDARLPANWGTFPAVDWVVTNPPFSEASQIVPLAVAHARVGVAMLLRLSFAEPCADRGRWLAAHPPRLLILPRISFTANGKTDSVTCAWFVWGAGAGVEIVPRE